MQDAVLALDEKMKGVDEDLYEKACQNTRIQTMWAFQNQLFGIAYRYSEATKQSWLKEWEKMMEFCRVNHPVNPEKPDVPLNKNDAFQKVQKRRVQEKR